MIRGTLYINYKICFFFKVNFCQILLYVHQSGLYCICDGLPENLKLIIWAVIFSGFSKKRLGNFKRNILNIVGRHAVQKNIGKSKQK